MTKTERNFRFEAAQEFGPGNFVLVKGTEIVSLKDRLLEDARSNMGPDVDPAVAAFTPKNTL